MDLYRRPLFLIAVAYIAGIFCAAQSNGQPAWGLAVVIGILVGGMLPYQKWVTRPAVGMLAAVFMIGFICTVLRAQVPAGDVSRFADGKLSYVAGTVASDVEPLEDGIHFVVRTRRVCTYAGEFPAGGLVMVKLRRPKSDAEAGTVPFYGDTALIHGRLDAPRTASNPGAFGYGQYLARKGIFCTLSSVTTDVLVVRPSARTPRWLALRFKSALTAESFKLFSPVHAGLLVGILLGNHGRLPLEVQGAFMRSGTMHLLVASGYNCAVVISIFGFILRRLTAPRAFTHWMLMALVWGFTLVVGPSPSIIRAAVMVTVFLTAYVIWRAPDACNMICAALLLILAANPLDLYDVGFQLSFAAVFGIISVMPLIEPAVRRFLTLAPRMWEKQPGQISLRTVQVARDIVFAVGISAVATVWTWPISAYYFNYVSVASVISNALVALLVVMLTGLGMASLALGWIWLPLGRAVGLGADAVMGSMLGIITGLGAQHWSLLPVKSPSPILIAAYYLVLFGVFGYASRRASLAQRMARTDRAGADSGRDLVSRAHKRT